MPAQKAAPHVLSTTLENVRPYLFSANKGGPPGMRWKDDDYDLRVGRPISAKPSPTGTAICTTA